MCCCPYVYVRIRNSSEWVSLGTIITDNKGQDSECETLMRLPSDFDGTMEIRELDPERSYIRYVYIVGESDSGDFVTVTSSDDKLSKKNDDYLILDMDEKVSIKFELPSGDFQWTLKACGYYDLYEDEALLRTTEETV